jgi:hypothetical protein
MENSCSKFEELSEALEKASAQAQSGDSASASSAGKISQELRYHIANCSTCREASISLLAMQPKTNAA